MNAPLNQHAATITAGNDIPAIPALGRWWTLGALLLALAVLLLWLAGYGPGAVACRPPLLAAAAPAPVAPGAAVIPSANAAVSATPAMATPPASAPPPDTTPAGAVEAAATPVPAPLPEPSTVYFALGKASLPTQTEEQLAGIVAYLRDNPDARASLAGFHDARGGLSKNQQLAQERAQAVRALLIAAGVAAERIDLRKPAETTGSGPDEQARRVEVSVER